MNTQLPHAQFKTSQGRILPALTHEDMLALWQLSLQTYRKSAKSMIDKAACSVLQFLEDAFNLSSKVAIVIGQGHKAFVGLRSAYHLQKKGYSVNMLVFYSKTTPWQLDGTGTLSPLAPNDYDLEQQLRKADIVLDAIADDASPEWSGIIQSCNRYAHTLISLDAPSGLNLRDGSGQGAVMRPNMTLALGLPNMVLGNPIVDTSDLFVLDMGLPESAIRAFDTTYVSPFAEKPYEHLECHMEGHSKRCRDEF